MIRIASAMVVVLAVTPTVARRKLGRNDVSRRMAMNHYTVKKDLETVESGLHTSASFNRDPALKTFDRMVRTFAIGEQLLAMQRPNAYIFNGYTPNTSSSLIRFGNRYALGYGYVSKGRPWVLLVLNPTGVSRIQFGQNFIEDEVNAQELMQDEDAELLRRFFDQQIEFANQMGHDPPPPAARAKGPG